MSDGAKGTLTPTGALATTLRFGHSESFKKLRFESQTGNKEASSTGTALKLICKSSQRNFMGLDWVFGFGDRNSPISHALLKSKHGEFTRFGKNVIVLLVAFLQMFTRWKSGEFHSRNLLPPK